MRITTFAALAMVATLLSSPFIQAQQTTRSVTLAPVEVVFDKNWMGDMNSGRSRIHGVREEDARRIAADLSADLQKALEEAVRARGFEVVSSPSTGTLRLTARIDGLYVNAPDLATPGVTRTYARETGRATLRAEGRDASGAVRMQSERHGTAGDHWRLERASDVTNRFWFDSLFRSWASEVAAELGARAGP